MNEQSDKATRDLPAGTVTFLFADIEGSTKLLRQLGDEYNKLLADQRRILRTIFTKWHGHEVDTQGDSFFVSFPRATEAVAAAVEIQRALAEHKWPQGVEVRVRMGLHTGEPLAADEGYVGMDVHRAARIAHVGHGGQVLLSETTAALLREGLPEGVTLLDLGLHSLKDMDYPEYIRQLVIQELPSIFPPLKSLEAVEAEKPSIPNNLPVQSMPFVGREDELADLVKLLGDPEIRMITIVGPGGMGKTRLALALAERQLAISNELSDDGGAPYRDGVFFIPLDGLDETEQIVPTIAISLRFTIAEPQESSGRLDIPNRTPKQQLLDYLSNKHLLLVMDNFEHLLDGAGLLSEIRQRAPLVEIIATSRERLRLHGEQLYQLHGMSVPSTDSAAASSNDLAEKFSSVRLFLQSAKRADPSFTPQPGERQECARICRLVDGLPLALELSAGWVDMLSLYDIAAEIEQGLNLLETATQDVPERHRSMDAVFQGSWRRLSPHEQSLFTKLCVFRGGFTRKSAEVVAGASLAKLAGLMSKSLLLFDRQTNRYDIHRLLRHYGLEQLATDPVLERDVRERHSDYYLMTFAALEDALYSDQYQSVTDDIDGDLENIRAALHWAAINQQVEFLGNAIPPLFQYYAWRYYDDILFKDAQTIVDGLVEQDDPKAKLTTARVLVRQGWFLPDPEDRELVEKSGAILQDRDLASLDTRRDKAFNLWRAGNFILQSGELLTARDMFDKSLALYREVGDRWGEARTIGSIAVFARTTGDRQLHARCIEDCAAICEELGNPLGLAWSFNSRALASTFLGNAEEAIEFARQSGEIYLELGDPVSIALNASQIGFYCLFNGHFGEALEAYEEAIAILEKLGAENRKVECTVYRALANLHIGEFKQAYLQAHQFFDVYHQFNTASIEGIRHHVLSSYALVVEDYGEALTRCNKAIELFRGIATLPGLLSLSLSAGSIAGVLVGNEVAAGQYMLECLQLSARVKIPIFLLAMFPNAALFVADKGKVEKGIELYEMACKHPFVANSQWYREVVGKHINDMAKALSPEVVQAARQRGRERDPWQTAEELLAELEAEETQV